MGNHVLFSRRSKLWRQRLSNRKQTEIIFSSFWVFYKIKIFQLPSLLNMIIEWVGRSVHGIVVSGRLVGSRWVGGHWIYYNTLLDSQSFKIIRKFYLPYPAHLTSRSFCFSSIIIAYKSMSFDIWDIQLSYNHFFFYHKIIIFNYRVLLFCVKDRTCLRITTGIYCFNICGSIF